MSVLVQPTLPKVTDEQLDYMHHTLQRADALNAALDNKTYIALTAQVIVVAVATGVAVYISPHWSVIWARIVAEWWVLPRSGLRHWHSPSLGDILLAIAACLFVIRFITMLNDSATILVSPRYRANELMGTLRDDVLLTSSFRKWWIRRTRWRERKRKGDISLKQLYVEAKGRMEQLPKDIVAWERDDILKCLARQLAVAEFVYEERHRLCEDIVLSLLYEVLAAMFIAFAIVFHYWGPIH